MAFIQSYSKRVDNKIKLVLIRNESVINLTQHICLNQPNSKLQ